MVGPSALDATPTPLILAFAASPRLLGLSLVVPSGPILLQTFRVDSFACRPARELEERTREALSGYRPTLVVTVTQPPDAREGRSPRDVLERGRVTSSLLGTTRLEITRAATAAALGLEESSRAAILRDMARRHPLVGSRVASTRGQRSESERYWELAVLAAAGAEVVLRGLSEDLAGSTPTTAAISQAIIH